MEEQLVVFDLAGEHYGLDISAVEGIIKMQSITKMPQAPIFVEGVTNLRGMVVPVIDLRKRFGMLVQEYTKDTRIVIVNMDKTKVGIVVDGVSEVLRVPENAIEPTPAMVSGMDSAFIRGIAKVDGRLITLLDLTNVLTITELKSIEKIT